MVFDCVVSTAVQDLGDVCPLVVELSVHQEQDPLLLTTPVNLLDPWIQMVVPAFTTLLSHASWQMLGYRSPSLRAVLLHKLENSPVLLLRPGSLNK